MPAGLRLPSPALVWRELVSRIGTAVPASSRPCLCSNAGWFAPGFAIRTRRAISRACALVSTLLFTAAASFVAWGASSPGANLLLGVGAAGALGYIAPMQYLLLRIRRRQHAIERACPTPWT